MSRSTSFSALVREPLRADAQMWVQRGWAGGQPGTRLYLRLGAHAGFRATVLFRLAQWAQRRRLRGLPTLLAALNVTLHGIEMTPSAEVGPGLYLPHPVGVVITAKRLGARVEIQGNVTIGQRRGDGFPTLSDDIVVACGARVLGPIAIGEGATIGANAVVITDVEVGSVMVGVPARPLPPRSSEASPDTHSQSRLDALVA